MSTSVSLPPALRAKIALLARRLRLLRAVRGLSLLVLVVVGLAGLAFLTDYAFDLPRPALAAVLGGLVAAASLVAVFTLVIPLCRRHDPEALAAIIEEKYPQLDERLTSTVELTAGREAPHGAAAFVSLLVRETEIKTGPLDFTRAVSGRASRRLALTALLAVLLVLVPTLLWADRSADFGRRLLGSWFSDGLPGGPGYSFQVKPGDAFAAKGRPLAFEVEVARQRDGVPLPSAGFLVTTDAAGKMTRLPLRVERPDLFTHEIETLPGDLRYQVQAGDAVSPWYRITAIEPVELAANSPSVTITAPGYVNQQVHPPQTLQGICDLSALQYSTVRFDFRFTRPAEVAKVEVSAKNAKAANGQGEQEACCEPGLGPWVLPVQLAADRREGRLELPALARGEYQLKLVLEAEHHIATVVDLRPLTVWPDEPPAFTELPRIARSDAAVVRADWAVAADPLGNHFNPVRSLSAGDHAKSVAPDDVLPLKVAVEDKVGVDRAEVEYRVNDGPSRFETLFQADGAQRGEAEYAFPLAGKVKDGDVLSFRLKAADNRKVAGGSFQDAAGARVPATDLVPQVIYCPAPEKGQDRWFVLRIDRRAVPLAQQEILAERDRLRSQIEAIRKKLRAERDHLGKVRAQTRNQPRLTPPEAQEVQAVRKENRAIRNDLRALARETSAQPDVQALADQAQDIAESEMTRSDAALARAADSKADDNRRGQEFQKADQELAHALERLDALTRQGDRLAQDRLDQMKLQRLAQREDDLAQRTGELTKKDLPKDPAAQRQLAEVKGDQANVAEELKRLTGESSLFKQALDAVHAEQAAKLAAQARELAQAQRDLVRTQKDAFKQQNETQLAELARKQQQLADQAARLARDTAPAARAADSQPLNPEQAQKAADALRQGDIAEALQDQDRSAHDLDQGAANLDRARDLARDPRAAARQLARLQDNLLKQLQAVVKKNDPTTPLHEQVRDLQKDERALERAIESLDLPAGDRTAEAARQQAARSAGRAADSLKRELPIDAPQAMVQARSFLERLAGSLPSLEQRTQQVLRELGELRRRQTEIDRQASQAARQAEKQPADARTREQLRKALADVTRRQAEVAQRLSKLDVGAQQARHTTAQDAVNKALDDLVTARAKDIQASQVSAKRELDHLAQALTSRAPAAAAKEPAAAQADARSPRQMAKQLAQQQRQLAQATQRAQQQARAGPKAEAKQTFAKTLTKLAEEQAKLDAQAGQLPANKAQIAWQQARQAMNQAQDALERGEARAAQGKQTEAANALDRLAVNLPDGKSTAKAKDPGSAPAGFPSPEQSAQARALAQAQKDLRSAVQKMTAQAAANNRTQPAAGNIAAQMAQQQGRQQDLQQQTSNLMKALGQLAQDLSNVSARPTAQQAAASARQAEAAMGQAQAQDRAGNRGQAQQAGQQAAQMLDQAAQQAAQAVKQAGARKPGQANAPSAVAKTGAALEQGRQQTSQAQHSLKQGQAQAAQAAMQQAAQALQQAAQSAMQSQQPGMPTADSKLPGPKGAAPVGLPDPSLFGSDMKQYAGRAWGELPGELRTRLLQDMRARYGEDYARIIQRYFQQIADTRKP